MFRIGLIGRRREREKEREKYGERDDHVRATRSSRFRGTFPRSQPSRFRRRRYRHVERGVREGPTGATTRWKRKGEDWKPPSGSSTVPRIIRRINWIVGGTWKLNTAKTGKGTGEGRLHVAIAKRETTHRCANIRAHSCEYEYTVCTRQIRVHERAHANLFEAPCDFGCEFNVATAAMELHEYARIFK